MPDSKKNARGLSGKFRKISDRSLTILLCILLIFTLQYSKIEIFNKEKNVPFSGDFFYNPYLDYPAGTQKANFHAHSIAWMNLTDGVQNERLIYDHYKKNGYDIASLSNYQKISRDPSATVYIPVYEHGYNITKSHQLVINSEKVCFSDFSLFQNYHTKQQVINTLKEEGGLIALAHPDLCYGYNESDIIYLKGYDFIEVLNNFRVSVSIWDAALSNGYPAWILSDDDSHDINDPGFTCTKWTRIGAASCDRAEVINALKRGCHYGVSNPDHTELNFLDSCIVRGNEIKVCFRNKADRIKFISDEGVIVKEVENSSAASYLIAANNSYVRVQAVNGSQDIYLNPIIRYDGQTLSSNCVPPAVNRPLTLLTRSLILLSGLLIVVLVLAINGKLAGLVKLRRYSLNFVTRSNPG